jgi:hypothetical protein
MARPPDLPSAAVLGAKRPHGHKMRYMAGCRCRKCKRGNSLYNKELVRKSALYGPNDLVPVDEVRAFLLDMRKLGIGYKTVAKHTKVGKTVLGEIVWPGKSGRKHIRRRTATKTLSYRPTLDALPSTHIVSAMETVQKVRQLQLWGYPSNLIAQDALAQKFSLQILAIRKDHPVVEAATARRVRDFYAAVVDIRDAWTAWRGPIPPRHYVYWKPGRRSSRMKDLELRPFAVTYDYAYLYPQPLKDAIRATRQIKKTIKDRKKNATEQNHRSTQSSVCNAGTAA